MTVATTNASIGYVGLGTAGPYPITFQYFDNSEISVFIRTVATGVLVEKTSPTHFTFGTHVAGTDDGQITFTAGNFPLVTAEEVLILRATSLTQNVDLTPSTKFPSASAEEGLDRAAMRAQEANEAVEDRSLRIPKTDELSAGGGYPDMELPGTLVRSNSGAGGTYLGFDTAGEPTIISVGATGLTASVFGQSLIDDLNALAARVTMEAVGNVGSKADAIGSGLQSALPNAFFFGTGFYWATDTLRLWYSNGVSTWTSVTLGQVTEALVPTGGFLAGRVLIDTDNLEILRDNGVAFEPLQSPWCRGSIGGLEMSRAGATSITVQPGEARSIVGNYGRGRNITLGPSAITKTLALGNSFAPGTGQDGNANTVAIGADTWYFVFLVAQKDGDADIAFDNNILGTNVTGAGEIFNFGYDQHIRYIGRIMTDSGSQIRAFDQHNDHFIFTTTALGFTDAAADYTTAVVKTITDAPGDLLCDLVVMVDALGIGDEFWIQQLVSTDAAPTGTTAPGSMISSNSSGEMRLRAWIHTSVAGSVLMRCNTTSNTYNIVVHGWIDPRGRDL